MKKWVFIILNPKCCDSYRLKKWVFIKLNPNVEILIDEEMGVYNLKPKVLFLIG